MSERARLTGRMSRVPVRVRLVTGFVIAMTILLFAAGGFVYWRVKVDLDTALDRDLADEFAATLPLVGSDGRVHDQTDSGNALAVREHQTLSATGEVLSSGPGAGTTSLLNNAELTRALRGPVHIQVGALLLSASRRPLRLLAAPIEGHGPAAVLVVGVQADQRNEALRELLAQLALAGFAALVLAAIIGERLAKAALAPVERYRAQAETIASGATGVRLDVPDARDDEVTRLGHTFNDVLAALERALDGERRFVNDASHELRTPLTLLSARVQLLRRRPRSVEEYERALTELETDIGDLIRLSEQLLDLGLVPDAESTPADEPVDVQQVVQAMGLADLGVHVNAEAAQCYVAMPASQIRQIVANLVANARTHGEPPVEVSIRSRDGTVVLTVTDAGSGISPDFLPLAVERFKRGDDAHSRPGTGLGLALVDALVRQHEGELRLCSRGAHHRVWPTLEFACEHPSSGTTVTVALAAVGLGVGPQ
jgi:two-component system OmpR family sensor kinase